MLVTGTHRNMDVLSMFQDEKFHAWTFMGHYGYFANTLAYINRFVMNLLCLILASINSVPRVFLSVCVSPIFFVYYFF